MEVHLFILGYLLQLVGSSLLFWQVLRRRSVYGLSLDTQLCLLLSTLSRCYWSLDTRLIDNPIIYAELLGSTLSAFALCVLIWRFRHTTTKNAPILLQVVCLFPVAIALAVAFHPGVGFNFVQTTVSFTMYLEAMALLPQLYLMRNMVEVEPLTSHYVGLLILSRACRIFFWIFLYYQGEHFVGLLLADLFHTVLAGDYLYLWIRKLRKGGALVFKL